MQHTLLSRGGLWGRWLASGVRIMSIPVGRQPLVALRRCHQGGEHVGRVGLIQRDVSQFVLHTAETDGHLVLRDDTLGEQVLEQRHALGLGCLVAVQRNHDGALHSLVVEVGHVQVPQAARRFRLVVGQEELLHQHADGLLEVLGFAGGRAPHLLQACAAVADGQQNLGLLHDLAAQVLHHGIRQERRWQHLVDHSTAKELRQHLVGLGVVQLEVIGELEQALKPLANLGHGQHLRVQRGDEARRELTLPVALVQRHGHRAFHKLVVEERAVEVVDSPGDLVRVFAVEELGDQWRHLLLESGQVQSRCISSGHGSVAVARVVSWRRTEHAHAPSRCQWHTNACRLAGLGVVARHENVLVVLVTVVVDVTSIDCNIGGVHVVDTSHTPRVLATSAALLRPPPVLHVRVRPTVVLRLLSLSAVLASLRPPSIHRFRYNAGSTHGGRAVRISEARQVGRERTQTVSSHETEGERVHTCSDAREVASAGQKRVGGQ
mmetsp:Transcript_35544/g.72599  ORF Transcript_35544/g.72599 Transcript_35544/m.72599 type:complete len:492 (-) Transcript_35544:52-1527(-)